LEEAWDAEADLRNFVNASDLYKKVWKTAKILE